MFTQSVRRTKQKAALGAPYGAGLRVSEVAALKVDTAATFYP